MKILIFLKMRSKVSFLLFSLILISSLSYAQSSINEFLLYHNKNEKVDYYFFFDKDYRIVFSQQIGSNPITIRLLSSENLVLDTLKYKLYPEGFHKVGDHKLMISGINTSVLVEIIDGKFHYENEIIIDDASDGTNQSIIKHQNTFSWQSKRQGRKNLNLQMLLNHDEILIDNIPKIYKNSRDNPTSKQRVLNLNQFVWDDYLISFLFRAQRVYFIDTENLTVKYFSLPKSDESVWYFFTDTITGRNYLIKENKEKVLELFAFYRNQGIMPLKEIDKFPESISGNKLIFKEITEEGTYHYGIPLDNLKSLDDAEDIVHLNEIEVHIKSNEE